MTEWKVVKQKLWKNKCITLYSISTNYYYVVITDREKENIYEARNWFRLVDALHDFNRSRK